MSQNHSQQNGHFKRQVINFGPGPAQLPLDVLQSVQDEFLDYGGSGSNIMELSHRSGTFAKIIQNAENDIREILSIPDSYAVLFLQGGATGQFSAIPLNFLNLGSSQKADYLVSGYWSEKAAKEAEKFGQINWVVPKRKKFLDVPDESTWNLSENASYFYYCANETIDGVEIDDVPKIVNKDVPIVCDMSSNFLTRTFDINKYAMVFASAQKNFGSSGLVLVILRKDWADKVTNKTIPVLFDYKVQISNGSMYNTPPTFSIYIANKMFEWVKKQGGLSAIEEQSKEKSDGIYQLIDQSNGFYVNYVEKTCRSRVNIPLRIVTDGQANETLESLFLSQANKNKMIELKGHRAVGGLRISLYSGMTIEETQKLIKFMKDFQSENQS